MLLDSSSETGGKRSVFTSNNGFEESPILLDENGFPLLSRGWESDDEDALFSLVEDGDDFSFEAEHQPAKPIVQEEEEQEQSSFAADFYRSGADWSSLKTDLVDEGKTKRLRQSNLLHMWDIKGQGEEMKNEKNTHLRQSNLLQMWGIKINVPGPREEMKNQNPHLATHTSPYLSRSPSSPPPIGSRKRTIDLREFGKSRQEDRVNVATHPPIRPCPFYKKIPGTPFTVDAFRYGRVQGCSGYFLTHFHYDHYGGLTKGWTNGYIYCTNITARLIRLCLSVNPSFIRPLESDVEHVIEGIKVTLLDANHCPGAALIHFQLPGGKIYLHTGDFRACRAMQSYPLLVNKRVSLLYLDTTYCNPKYRFPSKQDVLDFVVRTTQNHLKKQPKTLIIVGAYSIGKECVYVALSKALGVNYLLVLSPFRGTQTLNVNIFANASRRRVLDSFGWPDLSGKLCLNAKDTPLHVLPISSLRHESLKKYLRTQLDKFAAVVAFRPTGWTYSESIGKDLDQIKPSVMGNIVIYGVPYSEHSSFDELKEFVQFLKPEKIIPTVNVGNAANREKMQSYFREWVNG